MSGPKGKDSGFSRSGDLWHSLFGDGVTGGAVNFNYRGSGKDHITVQSGKDFHFSWDVDIRTGEVSGVHGKDQTTGKKY